MGAAEFNLRSLFKIARVAQFALFSSANSDSAAAAKKKLFYQRNPSCFGRLQQSVRERERRRKVADPYLSQAGAKKERIPSAKQQSIVGGRGRKNKAEGETNCTPTVKRRQRRSESEIERLPQMIPLLYPCSIDGSGKNGILWVILYSTRESLVSRERQSGSFAASPLRS